MEIHIFYVINTYLQLLKLQTLKNKLCIVIYSLLIADWMFACSERPRYTLQWFSKIYLVYLEHEYLFSLYIIFM